MTMGHGPPNIRHNWLRLGFRVGQLIDIVRPCYQRDEDDPALVEQLLVKLRFDIRACITKADDEAQLLRVISGIQSIWESGISLDIEYGSEKKFESIHSQLLQFEQIFQGAGVEAQDLKWFDIGSRMGQSSGCCIYYFEGVAKRDTCWSYRDRSDLTARLSLLGASLKDVSGLPETDDVNALVSFLNLLPDEAPIMRRYPPHRWGWGVIEHQIELLLRSSDSESIQQHDQHVAQMPDQTLQVTALDHVEAPRNPLEPGYLGLIVDESNKKEPVRRLDHEAEVELTEDRLWQLFLRYFRSRLNYLSKEDIFKDWEKIGNNSSPSPNTVSSANTALRQKLACLKVNVVARTNEKGKKESAWRLEPIGETESDD